MVEITKATRRSEIRPLCPIHTLEMSGPVDETKEFFSCPRHGCDLHWRPTSDYFRFYQDKPFRTFQQLQEEVLCSKPGHGHKFIARRSGNKAFWECSVEGCSETEERRLPPGSLWEIPKDQSRPVMIQAPAAGHSINYERALREVVPTTQERPGWVWVIFIWYTVAFLIASVSLYLTLSGSIPISPQYNAYFASLTAFDYVLSVGSLLLSLSAAVALFLLRRQATYLFWSWLAASVISNAWEFVVRNGVPQHAPMPGASARAIIGFGMALAVCLYAEKLKDQGTLQ